MPAGAFKTAFFLANSGQISQSFTASQAGLKDILVTFTKPNGRQTAGLIQWQLTQASNPQPVASGTLSASHLQNWAVNRLKLPYLADSAGRQYRITFSSAAATAHALAVPLYAPAPGQNPTVTTASPGQSPQSQNLTMPLVLTYAD